MADKISIRLFVTSPLANGAAVELGQEQAHYLKNVMRLGEGDAVALFNGSDGEFRARIDSFGKRAASLVVEEQLRAQTGEPDLWLVFAPIKRARIDYLVEKATELGASALVPVITRHTHVERLNLDRLRAHAVEALVVDDGETIAAMRLLWTRMKQLVAGAMCKGAIGFSPFGMDETGYWNYPLGAARLDDGTLDAFALNYRLFGQLVHVWPTLALTGKTWGVAEPTDPAAKHEQVIDLGKYKVTVSFGRPQFAFDPPKGNDYPSGGAVIAQLGPDEYLVTALHARVQIDLADPKPGDLLQLVHVEEGHYDDKGQWVFDRRWNGDSTDYGLNFASTPTLLRVKLATIR